MIVVKKLAVLATTFLSLGLISPANGQEKVNFEDHVRPIFRDKCFSCHNTNKKSSDLDLSSYSSLMQGGASGAVIEPGDPGSSYLYMLMSHESEPFMPPNADRLPDATLEIVSKWIEGGAPETASSKVMLPKKAAVNLSVDVAAGVRPEGPAPMPDVLNLEPVVYTETTTAVSAIATSPWAKLVAVAGQKQVILYHSETLQPLGVLPFPEGQARVLKFSRNGGLLLAGGGHGASKGLAVVWNIRTGERVMEVGDELDEVLAADISADQTLVALGGPQKVVRVYSTATKELVYEVSKHTDWIYSLEFSPDSVLLATADRNGGLHVWESHTGREYLTLPGHTAAVTAVSWRLDGNVLASGSEDGNIKLWEMENGGNIKSWGAHGGGVFSVEYCRDARIVSSGRDKVAKLWDANGGGIRTFEALTDLALQVSHCDETDRVIAGDWTGEIRVFNAADGTRVGELSTNPPLLEQRVAEAESLAPPATAVLTAAQGNLANATAALKAQQEKAAAAAKAVVDAESKVATQKAAITASEQKLAENTAKQTAQQEVITALKKAIPELKVASEKATGASSMMQSDEDLKKIAAQLELQVAARTTTLQETEKTLVDTNQAIAELNKSLEGLKLQLQTDEKLVVDSKAASEVEAAAVVPLQQALESANNALADAQNEVNRVKGLVGKWKNYIALRDELAAMEALRKERDATQLKALEAKSLVDEKLQAVAANQQTVEAARTMMAEAEALMKQKEAEQASVTQMLTEQQKLVAQQEQANPMVKLALEQTKSALAVLSNDAEIKASVDALAAVVERQQQEIAAGKEQIVAMTQTVASLKTDAENAMKTMAAAQQQMVAAQASVVQLSAEATPLGKQAEEAEAMFKQVEQSLLKAEEVVEARRQQIRPQLQLSST